MYSLHILADSARAIRRSEQLLPAKYLILTFGTSNLPVRVKDAYLNCRFRLYISKHFVLVSLNIINCLVRPQSHVPAAQENRIVKVVQLQNIVRVVIQFFPVRAQNDSR